MRWATSTMGGCWKDTVVHPRRVMWGCCLAWGAKGVRKVTGERVSKWTAV